MKCDKLQRLNGFGNFDRFGGYYDASEVDEAIAELMKEISNLKAKNIELQSFYDLHGNVDNYIDKLKAENTQLKQKLENVQASMYADVVDANMENRRLKRALWLARAERYKMSEFIAREEANLCNQISWSGFLRGRTHNQWVDQLLRISNLANKLQNKCRANAEEYK